MLTTTLKAESQVTKIEAGEDAPYSGILMPESLFRQYKGDHDYNKYLIEQESKFAAPCVLNEPEPGGVALVLGVALTGLIIGFSIGRSK